MNPVSAARVCRYGGEQTKTWTLDAACCHSTLNNPDPANQSVAISGRKTNQCITTRYGVINVRWNAVKCQRARRHRLMEESLVLQVVISASPTEEQR